MSSINQMKDEQQEEEVEKLSTLSSAKLTALWLELDLVRRAVRLTNDESSNVVLAAFYTFAAELAVEEGHVREDFLKMMGEMFDDALADIADLEEESDKGSTDGGPVPGPRVVS